MKRIYIFIVLSIFHFSSYSQAPNCILPRPINEDITDILRPLDKSQIPSGILYEAVFPWADIVKYNGNTNTDTTSTVHFVQAYNEIYNSAYNRISMLHPADLEQKLIDFNLDPDFHHPLAIIDFNFHSLKEDAITNNLLSVSNNKLYDVPNRTSSPYNAESVFIAVPLFADGTDRLYTGAEHTFYLDSDFILSNNGFTLNDYEYIDFEINGVLLHREYLTGTFATYAKDSSGVPTTKGVIKFFKVFIPKVFNVAGKIIKFVTIKLKKKLSGNKISRIELKAEDVQNLTACQGLNQIFVTGASFDAGYDNIPAYAAKGRGYIFFGEGNCATQQVKRPVIFLDGFDPTNTRKVWDIYNSRINREFRENGVKKKFGRELDSLGYDVIIYDYDEVGVNRGGAGLIENNALAFEVFLDSLYTRYQSTMVQDFIIIAPSMGAMIARYALADMEKKNIPHHTRTFISFDGPHQGGQVPLGVQRMIDLVTQYGGMRVFKTVKNAIHQSNAAKQMLVHHSYTGSETIEPHPFRTKFLSNLSNVNQYPANLRKVAVVNGNSSGIKKSQPQPDNDLLTACEKEFELEIVKIDPTCTDCDVVRIKTYTQTESTRCKAMDFAINNKTKLFKLVFGGLRYKEESVYTQSFNNQSYDIAPGGNFGADAEFNLDEFSSFFETFRKITSKNLDIPLNKLPWQNFMPTVSSVDYTFPNQPYNLNKSFVGIDLKKCAGTTPFDEVYAPTDKDLGHARNDERLINGFRHEIYDLPSNDCGPNCQNYETLTGTIRASSPDVFRAEKAIFLQPNFSVTSSSNVVFCATIGCPPAPTFQIYNDKNKNSLNSTFSLCVEDPFSFDTILNQTNCFQFYTNFKVFVKNISVDSYAEFSTNQFSWVRANLGDTGFNLNLNANPGQPQTFYARAKNDPTNIITINLFHCN
jgi:hypothetical protein